MLWVCDSRRRNFPAPSAPSLLHWAPTSQAESRCSCWKWVSLLKLEPSLCIRACEPARCLTELSLLTACEAQNILNEDLYNCEHAAININGTLLNGESAISGMAGDASPEVTRGSWVFLRVSLRAAPLLLSLLLCHPCHLEGLQHQCFGGRAGTCSGWLQVFFCAPSSV